GLPARRTKSSAERLRFFSPEARAEPFARMYLGRDEIRSPRTGWNGGVALLPLSRCVERTGRGSDRDRSAFDGSSRHPTRRQRSARHRNTGLRAERNRGGGKSNIVRNSRISL